MSCERKIKGTPEIVKRYIDAGESPEFAELFAAADLVNDELGERGSDTPLRLWLRLEKHVSGWDPVVTPELWDEWQSVKADYIAALDAKAAALKSQAAADQRTRDAAQRAARDQRTKDDAAEHIRCAALVEHLQNLEIESPELNPVNWQELHKLKKHPAKAKRDLTQRWLEKFSTLPEHVQDAVPAFYGPVTITLPATDDPVILPDDAEPVEDDDAEQQSVSSGLAREIYLTPYLPGDRIVHEGNADMVQAGINDPAFRKFVQFSEGVRRLLDLIGNPIDNVILPAFDPHTPEAAQDVDDIADNGELADIVPGLIPRGLTILHGDQKNCKSLWLQKLGIVIADNSGATFEGIQVDHGQVIYVTRDPAAEPVRVKSGVLEMRTRLGLQASGRLHLTGAPLILNEPSSVEHWLGLNAARLPCKMIVVDSLFSCSVGSLAQDTVVQGCMDGVRELLKHTDAVIAAHHDNKSGDIFGSVFLGPMLVACAQVERPMKDGRLGSRVAVNLEYLKFGDADYKATYQLEGPYLNRTDKVLDSRTSSAPALHRTDMLALIPTTPTKFDDARKLIEHLLSGEPDTRKKQWQRARTAWEKAGAVVIKKGTIRRVVEVAP
jgi:hypothetical protein